MTNNEAPATVAGILPDKSQVRPWDEVVAALPPLSKVERRALQDSIRRFGVIYPVLVLADGRIVDGHNRWDLSGGTAPLKLIEVDEESAFTLAVNLNIDRRQMSPEQIADARQKLRKDPVARHEYVVAKKAEGKTQAEIADALGVSRRTVGNWERGDFSDGNSAIANEPSASPDLRVSIPKAVHETIYQRVQDGEAQAQIAADFKVTPGRISQIATMVEARRREPEPAGDVPMPDRKFRCIVIDPPWPIQKIEREERPRQGSALDYPVMELEDIADLRVRELADETGCHLYLWVTQKFLPAGLELVTSWGFRYQCLMTWVKPGGFTPFSWMYNTEHVIFARMGSLEVERKGLKLAFDAPATRHSAKPDVFYERVVQATPGPRLEMFSRTVRDGFVAWGNEVPHGAS